MKAKYVIMIITMALSIIVFVGSIVKGVVGVADSVSGVISSSSSDYSTWESVNIGEKNVSVKFPTSPEIDNDGYYYAQGIDNYVSVEYGEDYLEGYSGKQIESILVESIGDEWYNDRGYKLESEALKKNDFCTYYEKIYYNEEDNDTVAVWCMAVEDDVTYIDYQVYGKYDEIEDKIDAYFATVKRVY